MAAFEAARASHGLESRRPSIICPLDDLESRKPHANRVGHVLIVDMSRIDVEHCARDSLVRRWPNESGIDVASIGLDVIMIDAN